MTLHWPSSDEVTNFVVGTLIVRYLGGWLLKRLLGLFKSILLKTEREVIEWIHYSEGAMKHGHQHGTPAICPDGLCPRIKKKGLAKY